MLFFDLSILEEDTNGDYVYLVAALEKFWRKQYIPKNSQEKHKPLKRLKAGNSWLLNPAKLFNSKCEDTAYKAQYIRLAGRRDFAAYKLYGVTYLDLGFFPDLNLAAVSHNPLISVSNNKLYFKYES